MGWNPKKTFRSIKDEWDRFRGSEVGSTLLGVIGGGLSGGDVTTALAGGYEANRAAATAKKAEQDTRRMQAERQATLIRQGEATIAKAAAERRGQGQVRQNAGIPMLDDSVKALSGGTLLSSVEDPVTLGKAKPLSNTTMLGG